MCVSLTLSSSVCPSPIRWRTGRWFSGHRSARLRGTWISPEFSTGVPNASPRWETDTPRSCRCRWRRREGTPRSNWSGQPPSAARLLRGDFREYSLERLFRRSGSPRASAHGPQRRRQLERVRPRRRSHWRRDGRERPDSALPRRAPGSTRYKHIITYEETSQQNYSSGREHAWPYQFETNSVHRYFIQLILKSQLQVSYLYACMPNTH